MKIEEFFRRHPHLSRQPQFLDSLGRLEETCGKMALLSVPGAGASVYYRSLAAHLSKRGQHLQYIHVADFQNFTRLKQLLAQTAQEQSVLFIDQFQQMSAAHYEKLSQLNEWHQCRAVVFESFHRLVLTGSPRNLFASDDGIFSLPALCQSKELLRHALRCFLAAHVQVDAAFWQWVSSYHWPGDLSELFYFCQAINLHDGPIVGVALERFINNSQTQKSKLFLQERFGQHWRDCLVSDGAFQLTELCQAFECLLLEETLNQCRNNQRLAASKLGVSVTTLMSKVNKFNRWMTSSERRSV